MEVEPRPVAVRRPALLHFASLAAVALVSGMVCCALCWNRTAREMAKETYYTLTGRPAVSRPNLERFGFDQALEFRSTPMVERPVNDPQSPGYSIQAGFEVAPHAEGLSYPVNMAFAADSPDSPEAPFYYVAELHGAIKWVDRQGNVRSLVDKLLNFPPLEMKTSDEFGISGLTLVPGTRDLIFTSPVQDVASGQFLNTVRRIYTKDGGREFDRVETLLILKGEPASPSNQIQQVRFGPDGKLYVSVGDSMNWMLARDVGKWGGKILRLNVEGTPCEDNPFFNRQSKSASQNYVYAFGLRNSFDLAFEADSPRIWAGDVGQDFNRLVAIERGLDLGWDGTDEAFCREARYLFQDRFLPAGICFCSDEALGPEYSGSLLVAGFGNDFGPGPGRTKRIVSFKLHAGRLVAGPSGLVAYRGPGQSTFLGLATGPDGLYFTDMFGEQATGKAAKLGRVMRISPSARTAALPINDKPSGWNKWSSIDRGKYLFLHQGSCAKCHSVDRNWIGQEGPDLRHAVPKLKARLDSREYWDDLTRNLTARTAAHQMAIDEVRGAGEDSRLRIWLRHHVLDPRFDNARGKMPGFGQAEVFDSDELEALLDFVLSLE